MSDPDLRILRSQLEVVTHDDPAAIRAFEALFRRAQPPAIRTVDSDDYEITGRNDAPIVSVTTGASDRTITLPDLSTMLPGDEIEVIKADAGAGIVTVECVGTDTLSGVPTEADLDSQANRIRLRSMRDYWLILEYVDNGTGFRRFSDLTLQMWGSATISYLDTATLVNASVSLPKTAASADYRVIAGSLENTGGTMTSTKARELGSNFEARDANKTTTAFQIATRAPAGTFAATDTITWGYEVIAAWA